MDIAALLIDLRSQKLHLEQAITALEELQAGAGSRNQRRGRKFMGEKERLEVSQRMKRYWANRRTQARTA